MNNVWKKVMIMINMDSKITEPSSLTPFTQREKLIREDRGMVFVLEKGPHISHDAYIKNRIIMAPDMKSLVGEFIIRIDASNRCEAVMPGMRINYLILATRQGNRLALHQVINPADGTIVEQYIDYQGCTYRFLEYDKGRYKHYLRKVPTYEMKN
jgi:hypothetical protein